MYFGSQEYIDAAWEQGFKFSVKMKPFAKEITHYHFAEQCAVKAQKKQDRFYGRSNKYQFKRNEGGKMELINAANK